MEVNKIGVHTSHCCVLHGCKYGDEDCPVAIGTHAQEFICEECDSDGIKDLDHLSRVKEIKVSQSNLKRPLHEAVSALDDGGDITQEELIAIKIHLNASLELFPSDFESDNKIAKEIMRLMRLVDSLIPFQEC